MPLASGVAGPGRRPAGSSSNGLTESKHHHIAFKEMVAVLLACAIWGRQWYGARINCRCDN